jgi:hypothetical protein
MRLYQHSARCPVALRSFLDCNPNYWCFIPLLWDAALGENVAHLPRIDNVDPALANVIMMGAIDNNRVARYLDHVPIPPAAYAFSYPQRQKQRLFFEQFLFSPIHRRPYSTLDLYKMAIIAVCKCTDFDIVCIFFRIDLVPDNCSKILRYIIETLFILNGDTKLNMICPIGGDPERRYGCSYHLVWCDNLNPPILLTATSSED